MTATSGKDEFSILAQNLLSNLAKAERASLLTGAMTD